MKPRDFIAFNNLDIPCKEEVVISIFEKDDLKPDGYSIRVPCSTVGPVSMDFKLAAFKV